ncbi:hypothetical protein ACFV3F_03585 [Streptomyces sp. NPDC059717]
MWLLALAFATFAAAAFVALLLLVPRDVPAISGTCALILTIAAFAVAIAR